MDKTAVASIVFGLGVAIAAMVFPSRYPNAPKWAINLIWWGGWGIAAAGFFYLIAEHSLTELVGVIIATLGWFWAGVVALLHTTVFWGVMVFAAGMAAAHWGVPFVRNLRERANAARNPLVTAWLTPIQAAEAFVAPELFSKYLAAQEHAKNLAGKERDDADYIVQRRRSDVVECLRQALHSNVLVAKGRKVTRNKTGEIIKGEEQYLPHDWGLMIQGVDAINLDTAVARNGLPQNVYSDVLIGRDERKAKPLQAAKTPN
jgi:hypothetical protein